MQIGKIQSEAGFTLIEVLVAMVILTIGILALYTMQIRSITSNFKASILTTESVLTADKVEQFVGIPYKDVADGSEPSPDGLYTIFWNVAVDVPSKNLKTIRVWVLDLSGRQPVPIELNYIKADII